MVWEGIEPGIYETWNECKKQIDRFNRPLYKSFFSCEEAEEAYKSDPKLYIRRKICKKKDTLNEIDYHSLSVDAACSGNPGNMEYRGVYTKTKEEVFHSGPFQEGTNNIGEFLAIVHGLTWLKQQKFSMPIYSDSKIAIIWVQNKKCRTKLELCKNNKPIFDLIERAEKWLKNNSYITRILKWNTKKWGEIFADFNRKK
ncbi:MAG: ribonuclease H family protein [Bacteroidales bacterium OttesenSCG-928-I14]|nr:ribonuclease H family protein [Bacteroidales bacterium OttesenSCG-928-I14]